MLHRTALYAKHVERGAKMADFGGWEMPIEFTGTLAEHKAVRESVGVFDVSHMGKIAIYGPEASDFVNSILVNDLDKVAPGRAQYSLLCNDAGGVVDDVLVYVWGADGVYVIPNATNAQAVLSAFSSVAPMGITVQDQQQTHGIIAVQGPLSGDVVRAVGLPNDLKYMSFEMCQWRGAPATVARSGYTGERGYEVVATNDVLPELWDAVVEEVAGVSGAVAGLGARDTLRLEMGYPLHGHELTPEVSPLEAGLNWAVGWDKGSFPGKDALVRQREAGVDRRLVGLRAVGKAIPRAGMSVLNSDGEIIGHVTSGTFSPTLREGIAIALLRSGPNPGVEVGVDVRGRTLPFSVVDPPFVPSRVR